MYHKLDLFTRTAMAAYMATLLNAGTDPVEIRFYTGVPPSTPLTPTTTQTLLGTLVCSDPAASNSGGTVVFGDIAQDPVADAGGTATWARIVFNDGDGAWDVDVSDEAGTGVIKLNTVTIVAGGPIQITSFVIPMGGA